MFSEMAKTLLKGAAINPTQGFDWWRLAPSFWIQNHRTDPAWDAALNRALDLFGVGDVGSHRVTVGPFKVWIANYPYAYGSLDTVRDGGLPRADTRRRLRRMIAGRRELARLHQLSTAIRNHSLRGDAQDATGGVTPKEDHPGDDVTVLADAMAANITSEPLFDAGDNLGGWRDLAASGLAALGKLS
jgi:hypothetical protein